MNRKLGVAMKRARTEFCEEFEGIFSARLSSGGSCDSSRKMNGLVCKGTGGFNGTHGGKGYGNRNEDGERLLESCESLDLVLTNTFFIKKLEHLVTLKSGERS